MQIFIVESLFFGVKRHNDEPVETPETKPYGGKIFVLFSGAKAPVEEKSGSTVDFDWEKYYWLCLNITYAFKL